jgi:large subunit ribosomal protein L24e
MEKDSKELEQDIGMLPKKLISNHLAAEKTKVKVEVVQQQTEDNAMEE